MSKKKVMKVRLNNHLWDFSFALPIHAQDGQLLNGVCDYTRSKYGVKRSITISPLLSKLKLLDVIIHEMLHAICWSKSERWVNKRATELATVLWNLGYRDKNSLREISRARTQVRRSRRLSTPGKKSKPRLQNNRKKKTNSTK